MFKKIKITGFREKLQVSALWTQKFHKKDKSAFKITMPFAGGKRYHKDAKGQRPLRAQ